MNKKGYLLVLFCLSFCACFKRPSVNINALLHQRACIESIEAADHVRGRTHCELCLEFDGAMPECLNGLGLIFLANTDEENARLFFTKAVRQDNDFSQARNNLGVTYFSHGDFETSLKYFDRALEIDPSNADARYNAALSHFRLAQRMRAQNSPAQSLAHLLIAKDQMRKLLAIEPSYDSALRDLGLIDLNLYDLNDFEDQRRELLISAKVAFTECLRANSEEDGCYEGLAQVSFEEGQFDKAFANYFLCLNYLPTNAACRQGIVVAYEKSAKAEGGYTAFSTRVENDNKSPLAHEAFCNALFERGFDTDAVKECELALRLKPDLCSVHFRLAEYFGAVLNGSRAHAHCQSFLQCTQPRHEKEIKKCQEVLATIPR